MLFIITKTGSCVKGRAKNGELESQPGSEEEKFLCPVHSIHVTSISIKMPFLKYHTTKNSNFSLFLFISLSCLRMLFKVEVGGGREGGVGIGEGGGVMIGGGI